MHTGRDVPAAARGDARAGILAEAGARALFAGEVLEVRQRGRDPLGTVTIAHHRDRGRTLRVEMADEYLLALDDGEPVACVPDLICVLDARSWRPICRGTRARWPGPRR